MSEQGQAINRGLRELAAATEHLQETLRSVRAPEPDPDDQELQAWNESYWRACQEIAEDRLARLAAGTGTAGDWRVTDQLMARDGQRVVGRATQQAYEQIAAHVTGMMRRCHPVPAQDMAWQVLQQRQQAAAPPQLPDFLQPEDAPPGGSGRHAAPSDNRFRGMLPAGLIGSILMLAGIILVTLGNDWAQSSQSGGVIGLGVVLILLGVATPCITLLVLAIRFGNQQHRAWLASKPPSEREDIIRRERAAALAAAATAAVVMHETGKSEKQKIADSVMGRR